MTRERVVVVGAGLAGLAVAARLLAAGREVLVLEAESRAGGQIHTFRQGPLVVELGAEGFVARSRAVPSLCELLGIEGALVDQLTTDTYALEGDALALLPPGEAARRLGFQVPTEELGRGIRSLALGMGQLIDVLVERVGPSRLRLHAAVRSITRAEAELSLELDDGTRELATSIVLATPARLAASLLAPLGLASTEPLRGAPLLSNVSVNLLYRRAQLASYPAGSGVIFPESMGQVGLRALSIVEHKFAGRVADGESLLRVFFRPVPGALETWSDARFAEEAASAIGRVLTASGGPEQAWVSRWREALPVYSPEHRTRVAAADSELQTLGIHVAGSAFHGAGIDAAVASAENVAARISA